MASVEKFPDYIYSPNTGYLYVTKTNTKFMESSEYVNGPKKFIDADEAQRYLRENNFTGILGVRFTN